MKMNKKLLASLVVAGILSTGTAFANPFDDVPKDHWSYDAVKTLADRGIIDGYGDGTFRGDKLITRYEMAQIVGRAISRGGAAGSADKATIDKLSLEYADELNALGIRVDKVEKETAGVRDLKISHWIQTENTYGDTTARSNDSLHEYELEYRLTFEKQISDKLSALHQLETKAYWDQSSAVAGGTDGTYTRLAYLTYKPDEKSTIIAGKNAHWLAGGLLGDDYMYGIDFTTKFDDKTSFELLHGRYWIPDRDIPRPEGKDKHQITYAGVNTKLGDFDLGGHYLYGNQSLVHADRSTNIWAVTAGVDWQGINWSAGYAENTKADNSNKLAKAQLYKKMGKTDVFVQYWKQQGNIDLPMENGNHLAWWGDMYANWDIKDAAGNVTGHDGRGQEGLEGWRLILGHPISENCYAEAWYGDYDNLVTDENAKKFGWALTFSY